MRIAILGATSQIAKDLVRSFHAHGADELVLYARRPEAVTEWLSTVGLPERYTVADFAAFSATEHFDAILNFVGVGNPAQAAAMGAAIFDVTLQYDELALNYVRQHPRCRYIFLSSGAAYGSNFDEPVDENTKAMVPINCLQPQDWYGVAKMHAECRHRSLPHLPIVDIRVFNYFSHTQDMSARFLITDILRAVQSGETLVTSSDNISRDYIGSEDFFQLVMAILGSPARNESVDCYSKAPTDKTALLAMAGGNFGLAVQLTEASTGLNSTGMKRNYYSLNHRAAAFGYQPQKSSLELIFQELSALTNRTTGRP
jgi:nucleoside-diphosphate-sugar epimerase